MTTEENKAKGHGKGPVDEGSPITVGGGGGLLDTEPMHCDFDEGFYTDQTGGGPKTKRFANANSYARSLTVDVNGAKANLSGLLSANGECEVKVKCPGINNDLTISGGRPMGVELHTGVYRDPPAGSHRRDGNAAANELVIKVADFEIKRKLESDDVWEIKVDYL